IWRPSLKTSKRATSKSSSHPSPSYRHRLSQSPPLRLPRVLVQHGAKHRETLQPQHPATHSAAGNLAHQQSAKPKLQPLTSNQSARERSRITPSLDTKSPRQKNAHSRARDRAQDALIQ